MSIDSNFYTSPNRWRNFVSDVRYAQENYYRLRSPYWQMAAEDAHVLGDPRVTRNGETVEQLRRSPTHASYRYQAAIETSIIHSAKFIIFQSFSSSDQTSGDRLAAKSTHFPYIDSSIISFSFINAVSFQRKWLCKRILVFHETIQKRKFSVAPNNRSLNPATDRNYVKNVC